MSVIMKAGRLLGATLLVIVTTTAAVADNGLDVDGDGQQDALTDGMLVLRYLFGMRGAALVEGAVAEGCSRCEAQTVTNFLDSWSSQGGGRCGFLPDLIAQPPDVPETAALGERVTLSAEFVNSGDCRAPGFAVDFRLAEQGSGSTPLTGVGCRIDAGLGVGETVRCEALWSLGWNLSAGQEYRVLVVVDSENEVTESDETNNTRAAESVIAVFAPRLPDLSVSEISAPTTGAPGGKIEISAEVANTGDAAADAFRLGFYFSIDDAITPEDTRSSGFCNYQSGLAAGASNRCNGAITVPATLATGQSYYFGAYVDDELQVAESDESNNSAHARETIVLPSAKSGELWQGCLRETSFSVEYTTDLGQCTNPPKPYYGLKLFADGTFEYRGSETQYLWIGGMPHPSQVYPEVTGTWTQQGDLVVGADESGEQLFRLQRDGGRFYLYEWRTSFNFTHLPSIGLDYIILLISTF